MLVRGTELTMKGSPTKSEDLDWVRVQLSSGPNHGRSGWVLDWSTTWVYTFDGS